MKENIMTGLFTLGGIILGAFLTWLFNYLNERRNRKDRYFFALLEKRFNINQEAYYNAEKLKSVVHSKEDIRNKVVKKVQIWFNKNNLYLEPKIRELFRNTILDVSFYKLKLDNYHDVSRTEGSNSEKAKEKEIDLEETFKIIMKGLQEKIQADVDLYYKYLK